MDRIEVLSRIGGDGVLRLNVPMPPVDAGREVRVIVEAAPLPLLTQEEWRASIMRLAGSISDPTFRRHEQGEHQERDPLP